ncbi:phosphotransferase [Candidatus Saccharibacteria bacterium]|nr:phosphotransferase [Candidatus Saccharibacteria bacterium]
MTIEDQLIGKFGLEDPKCKNLNTLANDSYEVVTSDGHFALKVYNATARTAQDVRWELDLTLHLINNSVPAAKPVKGKDGYLQSFNVDGQERAAVLFEWADGEKPKPELSTYTLIGEAAAKIHEAADTFKSDLPREEYDMHELFDDQLARMKVPLEESGQWQRVFDLTERMRKILSNPKLDYGVIHNDLTLDNIHLHGDSITVFDFDSAAKSWRAAEPWGVLKASEDRFKAWLKGYRSVRKFSQEDEQAVNAFVIVEDIRNVVWKLGYARSSRGKPLMQTEELPKVVDEWLDWEYKKINT